MMNNNVHKLYILSHSDFLQASATNGTNDMYVEETKLQIYNIKQQINELNLRMHFQSNEKHLYNSLHDHDSLHLLILI